MRLNAFRLFLLVLVSFALAGCSGKVAVINEARVYQESNVAKAGAAYIEVLSNELQSQLDAVQEEGRKSGNPKNAQANYQAQLSEAQQRYSAEQQQVMNKFNSLYLRALEDCRVKEKIDIIVKSEAVLAHNPKTDITQKVIDEMNRTPVTFAPLAPQVDAVAKPAVK